MYLSRSFPDLLKLSWVTTNEEDTLQEEAEEALNELYDSEIAAFYDEARKISAASRQMKD